jgi:hypothetical protein
VKVADLVDFLVKFVVLTIIMLALVYKCMYVPSDALSFVRVGRCQAALERRRAPPVYHVIRAAKANPALLLPGLL